MVSVEWLNQWGPSKELILLCICFFPYFFLRSTSPQILWLCLFKFGVPPILFDGFVAMFRTTIFPIQTFFLGIPIRHISGESENLELEALEALEAPVAPNRQDHLKWLLGVSRIIWKGRSEGCFFCILGFKKVDLNP